MAEKLERWRTLKQLEQWLDPAMLFLSLVWLVIVVVELTYGPGPMLSIIATVIWIVFIAEFVLRFALAPGKRTFLKHNWLTLIALLVPWRCWATSPRRSPASSSAGMRRKARATWWVRRT